MALITDPIEFIKGQDTDVTLSSINTRFDNLYNEVNGSLSNANFIRNAAIAESKLDLHHNTKDLAQRAGNRRRHLAFTHHQRRNPLPISLPVVSSFIPQQRMDTNGVFNSTTALPFGVAYDEDRGVLWVSDEAREVIYRVNTTTGAALSSFAVTGTGPLDVGYESDNVWIIGGDSNEFYRYNTLGTLLSSFDQPTTVPHGITVLNGLIYYTEDTTSEIYKLNTLGTILGRFDITEGTAASRPRGIGDDGQDLWYSEPGNALLMHINTLGTVLGSYEFGSYGPTGNLGPNIMGVDHDGSHVWAIDSLGYMLRVLPMQWDNTPHYVSGVPYTPGGTGNIIPAYTTRDRFYWNIAGAQTTWNMAASSFTTTESPTGGRYDIAIKRLADKTVDDLYVMTCNTAAAAGNVVTRYIRGTFQSSMTLANLTGALSFRAITFGDNYMWLGARDLTSGDQYIFQIQSTVYDVDTTGAAALSSFQVVGGGVGMGDLAGIDYADWDANRHCLWASEGGVAGAIYRINTTGGALIQSFTYSLGGAEVGRAICVPNAESVLFTEINGELIYLLNTLGTTMSSWAVGSSGANPNWSGLTFDYNLNVLWFGGESASGTAEVAGRSDWFYSFTFTQ